MQLWHATICSVIKVPYTEEIKVCSSPRYNKKTIQLLAGFQLHSRVCYTWLSGHNFTTMLHCTLTQHKASSAPLINHDNMDNCTPHNCYLSQWVTAPGWLQLCDILVIVDLVELNITQTTLCYFWLLVCLLFMTTLPFCCRLAYWNSSQI